MAVEPDTGHVAVESISTLTAESLNRIMRNMQYAAAKSNGPTYIDGQRFAEERRGQTFLLDLMRELAAAGSLSRPATVADWPRVGHAFSQIPLFGGMLAFLREIYGSLWFKAHRRAPFGQQIVVNQLVVAALQELGRYMEDLDHISAGLDRESQAWKKDVSFLQDDLLALRSRVETLRSAVDIINERDSSLVTAQQSAHTPVLDADQRLAFDALFRGPSDSIRESIAPFVGRFVNCAPILDGGCGRGIFLELACDSAIDAYGVEQDPAMVALCRQKDLRVIEGDLLEHLRMLSDNTLGGMFLSHVIEHLTPLQQMQLVKLVNMKLKPGAWFVIMTPNPMCLLAMATHFVIDPTHVRPLHPEYAKFMLHEAGFIQIEYVPMSPTPEELRLRLSGSEVTQNQNLNKLNDLLFGYQDYALMARKEAT
jgi:2-polyprenyl-3-methyl-5-hydroxy-6-metoxy-1,4-benzoquinol methylase